MGGGACPERGTIAMPTSHMDRLEIHVEPIVRARFLSPLIAWTEGDWYGLGSQERPSSHMWSCELS